MAEILYNGIALPSEWPPRTQDIQSTEPMRVPYLESPPEVIPIDVGRQLFVDDFLIESTTLTRRFHRPAKYEGNPVLQPETELEMDDGECPVACPFNDGCWYDPADGKFKLWYHAGWFDGTGYATSDDGIHWERPELDVVWGTNNVIAPRPGYRRDGCCVCLDHDAADAAERFKMFQFFRSPEGERGEVYCSPDGIHWGVPSLTSPLGDNSSFSYNPFRKKWVFSIRRGWPVRVRWYREDSDFREAARWGEDEPVFWVRSDRLDVPDPAIGDEPQLYDVNAVGYESIMIGLLALFYGPSNKVCAQRGIPKTNDLMLAFSRDGFHWDRSCREAFIASERREDAWDRAYIHATGGGCLVVGDQLHFYYGAFSGRSPKLSGSMKGSHRAANAMYAGGSTGLAVLRRDGFASMEAGSAEGRLVTRPLTFSGEYLFVNADCPGGELRVAVLASDGRPLEPFSFEGCVPLSVDSTRQPVRWEGADSLAELTGREVRFEFSLRNGRLYSFWVSPSTAGESNGYPAAGGPGAEAG